MAEVKLVIKEEKRGPPVTKTTGEQLQDLAKTALKVGAGLAAVGVTAKKAFDLANEGAQINQLTASFEMMNERVFKTPGLLDSMSAAVRGTVKETDLMKGLLTLTAGATDEVSRQLAAAAPRLLEIAKASNKLNPALGDTTFLFDSIAKGVKRQSPLILDNLGIVIKLESAYKEYAQSVGKTVKELDSNERVLATLNATMNAGDQLINQVGGSVDSQADSYAELTVRVGEATEGFKQWLAGGLTPVVDQILRLGDATDQSDKASTRFVLGINALNVALGGNAASVRFIKNLTSDYTDRVTEAASRAADHTNFIIENTEAIIDNSNALSDAELRTRAVKRAIVEYGGSLRNTTTATEDEFFATLDLADSAETARNRFIELSGIETKREGSLATLTNRTKEHTAALGGYFVAAINGTDETSLFGVSLDKLGTTYSTVGGLTNQQREDLGRLQDAYDKAERVVHDYDIGLKGAGLSTDEIAEKVSEQREEMDRLAGVMAPLTGITGDVVSSTQEAAFSQDALTDALFEAATAADVDAVSLAVLAAATGDYTDEEIKAALQAAVMQEQISLLAQQVADGSITAQEAVRALDDLQNKMAEDFTAVITVDDTDAHDKLRRIAGLLDDIDGRKARASVTVSGDAGPAGKGFEKGGTPTQFVTPGREPEFGDGGRFMVGGGGGRDSQPVFFNASPGEEVTIRTPEQQGNNGDLTFTGDIIIQGGGGEQMADEFLAALGRKTRSARQAGAGVMGRTF